MLNCYALLFTYALNAQTDTLPDKVYYLSKLPAVKEGWGKRIRIMDGRTRYIPDFEVSHIQLEPGKSINPHSYTEAEELLIVKKGVIKVTIAEQTKTLDPGAVAMAMPGAEIFITNTGTVTAGYYLLKYTSVGAVNHGRAKAAGGSVMVNWRDVEVKITDRGFRREQFIRPTALFEKFDMHATTLKQGEVSHQPHTHRQEEIILVLRGTIEMQIGNTFHKAVPGDLVFLNAFIPHSLKNLTEGECEYFAFQWE